MLKYAFLVLSLGVFTFGAGWLQRSVEYDLVNSVPIRDGSLDPTFEVYAGQYATGTVNALANGPGDKVYIAGFLLSISGAPVPNIARLNPDGSVDRSFDVGTGPNNTVSKVLLQQDGKVLVSGGFTSVNGVTRNGTARLNPDGSLDTSFPQISSNASAVRLDFCGLEPDGDIFICGDFTMVNGIARSGMARLTPSGLVDQTFSIGSGFGASQFATVFTVAPVDGAKLLLGGFFTTINGVARNGIARLNSDGSLDQAFVLDGSLFLGTTIVSIQALAEGRILVAGLNRIARIFSDGRRDPSFANDLSFSSNVRFALSQTDGKVMVGGSFNEVQIGFSTFARRKLARLNNDGSLDESYLHPFPQTQTPDATYLQAAVIGQDGKITTGAYFTSSGKALLRVNSDGSIDNDFRGSVLVRGLVFASLLEPDGKIMVGGLFHFLGSSPRRFLGRLNADGTVDPTFDPGVAFSEVVYSVVRQPDGKYLVGTSTPNTGAGPAVRRLLPNGTIDTTFSPPVLNAGSRVNAMALQPDGRVLIGGGFNSVNGSARQGFARLNAAGSLDPLSVPISVFSGGLVDIVVQPTGKIVIGGLFNGPSGSGIGSLARINVDGTLDSAFSANLGGSFSGNLHSVSQIGQDLYIGDNLNLIGGGSKSPPVKLDQDGRVDLDFSAFFTQVFRVSQISDGKLLVAGQFQAFGVSGTRYSIARILANGGLDNTFDAGRFVTNVGQSQESIFEAFPISEDKIFAVGFFDFVAGQPKLSMVRLDINRPVTRVNNDFDADAKVDLSVFRPSTGTWRLQRSTAGMFNIPLGAVGDRLVPGDYDGDGVTDAAVYRPSEGKWYVAQSSNGVTTTFSFGTSDDFATPGDFDGDGRTDYGVFKPSTGQWTIVQTSGGTLTATLGQAGDLPVVGDYDGDRRADIGVFRPSTATWHLQRSTAGDFVVQFGNPSDHTVQADYDGDGTTDLGMFRRADATWRRFFMGSQMSDTVTFGESTDLPVAGDYDGDGRADIAVFRRALARWLIQTTSQGYIEVLFGSPGDSPIPNVFVYSAGFEGDIAPRPFGDGQIQTNDVVQARRFVTGLDAVTSGMNEFQRADTSPRTTFGDGTMSAADVVQARRYASGLDPSTDAAGPSVASSPGSFSVFGDLLPEIWMPEIQSRNELRIAPEWVGKANQISILIELVTNECPTALSFTLDYDSTQLSNPRVYLGKDVLSEAVLTHNATRKGSVAILFDSSGPMVPCVMTKHSPRVGNTVLTVTFGTSSRYRKDFSAVRISDRIARISLSGSSAVDLPIYSAEK